MPTKAVLLSWCLFPHLDEKYWPNTPLTVESVAVMDPEYLVCLLFHLCCQFSVLTFPPLYFLSLFYTTFWRRGLQRTRVPLSWKGRQCFTGQNQHQWERHFLWGELKFRVLSKDTPFLFGKTAKSHWLSALCWISQAIFNLELY